MLSQPLLSCFICQQDFHTARAILQHVQFIHHMDIVLPKSAPSLDQMFLPHDKQVSMSSDSVPTVSHVAAENGVGCTVPTATTSTDSHSMTISGVDTVSVSPSKQMQLPVMCAKLASSEGTTICCNGKECQVTVQPPTKTVPPKKCCSSGCRPTQI